MATNDTPLQSPITPAAHSDRLTGPREDRPPGLSAKGAKRANRAEFAPMRADYLRGEEERRKRGVRYVDPGASGVTHVLA